MSENILIEVSPGETRIAFTDDRNRLREFQIERVADKSLIEGVYRGRVAKLERGINGAFVDIGTGIDVFLNRVKGIHEGEWLIVQVFREAVAGKSPAARREISIAGRYVVFRPGGLGVHWPKKLKFGRKRAELDRVFESVELLKEGWTVRSQAAHAPERQILQEMERLRRRWTEAKKVEGDCLLAPTNLVERVLRDRASIDSMITVDDRRLFFKLSRNKMSEWPEVGRNLAFYEKDIPIFAAYGLADEIETLTEKEVALLRGGRITIDLTEAMTVIDVDMGGAGGDSLKEDAVLSVNLSAASEIARQIRLRNLSGLIVVDFINMRQRSRGLKIINAMRQAFYDSAVPVDVLG
ncbi:MAG: Ribonuclease G, partial [Alphaproteobacteria bacterium MarineAlpha4_Bin2]